MLPLLPVGHGPREDALLLPVALAHGPVACGQVLVPLATLMAVADHGQVTGVTAEQDPTPELGALADAGIDLDQVTDELLVDGVKQFEDAMNRLLDGIRERIKR